MKKLVFAAAFVCTLHTLTAQSDTNKTVANKEQRATPHIKVFPNPATRVVNVLGLHNSSNAKITISDVYGKVVFAYQREIRNNALNIPIAELESGIYIVAIHSKEQQLTTKFYKQ